MGIKILFRNKHNFNQFRNIVTDIPVKVPVDNVLLCSGFFQNGHGNYYSACENCFCCKLHSAGVSITTVGVYNAAWKSQYFDFIKTLRDYGIPVRGLYKSKLKWHAKVLLYKHNNEYVCGIIGSSNMTRPAFSLSIPFNYEADVLLFNSNKLPLKTINDLLNASDNPYSVIDGVYNVENNQNITIIDRLRNIEEIILNNNNSYQEI